jgi:hypothetical protein
LNAYILKPDDGVHTPEGTFTDPYERSSLKFGGAKFLNFNVDNLKKGIEIKNKVDAAGYSVASSRLSNGVY